MKAYKCDCTLTTYINLFFTVPGRGHSARRARFMVARFRRASTGEKGREAIGKAVHLELQSVPRASILIHISVAFIAGCIFVLWFLPTF